jgi:phage gp16-like protein
MPQRHEGTKKKTRRDKLLAMVHIALKDLGICDEDYREILEREFGKRSAADLSELELGYLVDYFQEKGWGGSKVHGSQLKNEQVQRLRERAYDIAGRLENGEKRLAGLSRKILGVDHITWSRDVPRLKRLLAILESLWKDEGPLYD